MAPAEWDDREGKVRAKVFMYIYSHGKKKPLRLTSPNRLRIHYGDKSCKVMEATHVGKLEENYFGYYYCYISHADLPADTLIELEYRHDDGSSAASSVRWPGLITAMDIGKIAARSESETNTGLETSWFLLLTNDMDVSWTPPETGRPDSIQMKLASPGEPSYAWFGSDEASSEIVYFEKSLDGNSDSLVIPKNTFTGIVSYLLSGRLYYDDSAVSANEPKTGAYYRNMVVSLTSAADGVVSPLLAGGLAQARVKTSQKVVALPCASNDYDPAVNMWYFRSDIK